MQYIADIRVIPNLEQIEDAMETISSIGVVMLGSLPAAEMLRRALSKPLMRLGRRVGMKDSSLVGFVSISPALAMMKEMDRRGRR